MGIKKDYADQDDDKPDAKSDSWESVANSGPESVTGDNCLTCSDTEDAAVKSVCKKFHEKVWDSCNPTKQASWRMHS